MIRKNLQRIVQRFADWMEGTFRAVCGKITPDKRFLVVLVCFVLFTGLSIYTMVSAIYNLGKDRGKQMVIDRIEGIDILPASHEKDSINFYNNSTYETE